MSKWLVLSIFLAACGGSSSSGPLHCTEKPMGGNATDVSCFAAICQCGATIASTNFSDRCAEVCKKTQPFHCEQFPQQTVWTIENLACDQCAGIDGGTTCP
jgi:hypothetical protein